MRRHSGIISVVSRKLITSESSIFTCIYIHIRARAHTHTNTHTERDRYTHADRHIRMIHTFIHTHTDTDTQTHRHTHTHTHTHQCSNHAKGGQAQILKGTCLARKKIQTSVPLYIYYTSQYTEGFFFLLRNLALEMVLRKGYRKRGMWALRNSCRVS
jgi:hypothetical protein